MRLDISNFETIASDFVKLYQQKLEEKGYNATGTLSSTLQYTYKDENGKKATAQTYHIEWDGMFFILEVQLQHYWKFLEDGTKPHMPPVWALRKWIEVKKIMPRDKSNLPQEKKLDNLAWAMAYKIKAQGTKAHNPMREVLEESDIISRIKSEIISQINVECNQFAVEILNNRTMRSYNNN